MLGFGRMGYITNKTEEQQYVSLLHLPLSFSSHFFPTETETLEKNEMEGNQVPSYSDPMND